MKKLLKEPLVHFLVIGAALFGLNALRHKSVLNSTPRIEVTAAAIDRLSASYERQFGHAPDETELRGLVAAQIREEVLYREAVALGLDRDDSVVRRRLAQKMEFLTDDVVGAAEPDDATLQKFFAQKAARYAKPARVSFRQVYFSKEKRGADVDRAAHEALGLLRKGLSEEIVGDSFLHGFEFADQEVQDIAALFGEEFAAQIATAPVGEWTGPVPSSYGSHLVRVETRGEMRPVKFNEVREAVLRDFTDERRRNANREMFEKLRERYQVTVDESALAKTAAPSRKIAQQ
jgi:hypothetical protein